MESREWTAAYGRSTGVAGCVNRAAGSANIIITLTMMNDADLGQTRYGRPLRLTSWTWGHEQLKRCRLEWALSRVRSVSGWHWWMQLNPWRDTSLKFSFFLSPKIWNCCFSIFAFSSWWITTSLIDYVGIVSEVVNSLQSLCRLRKIFTHIPCDWVKIGRRTKRSSLGWHLYDRVYNYVMNRKPCDLNRTTTIKRALHACMHATSRTCVPQWCGFN
jgi:hypothetical protein